MTLRREWWIQKGLLAATLTSVAAIFLLLFLLLYFSFPLLFSGDLKQLFSWRWNPFEGHYGILPMMLGTLLLSILSTVMAFPAAMGICAFIYIHRNSRLSRLLLLVVHVMTSIPTVIYGFVSVFILVPPMRRIFAAGAGFCLLTAALTLGLLILPTIVLVFHAYLTQAGGSLRAVSESLGLTPMEQFCFVMLPSASRGLVSALILGFCRAVGDAMIPLMLAGNAAQIPASFLDSIRTLSAHVALVLATDSQSMAYQSVFASGLLLFVMIAMVTALAHHLNRNMLSRCR